MNRRVSAVIFGFVFIFLSAGVSLLSAQESAPPEDQQGSRPIICAISSFYECDVEAGCVPRTASELNAPQFLKILLDRNEIEPIGVPPQDKHVSRIVHMAEIDGMLILQGVEDGDAKQKDGVGWSISIVETTGKMAITASGHSAAFIGMGACSSY